jgi:hypothetical protein
MLISRCQAARLAKMPKVHRSAARMPSRHTTSFPTSQVRTAEARGWTEGETRVDTQSPAGLGRHSLGRWACVTSLCLDDVDGPKCDLFRPITSQNLLHQRTIHPDLLHQPFRFSLQRRTTTSKSIPIQRRYLLTTGRLSSRHTTPRFRTVPLHTPAFNFTVSLPSFRPRRTTLSTLGRHHHSL